jgi:hypothetical protein
METSRLLGILLLILQFANLGTVFIHLLPVEIGLYVAASIAGLQAFTAKIQSGSAK